MLNTEFTVCFERSFGIKSLMEILVQFPRGKELIFLDCGPSLAIHRGSQLRIPAALCTSGSSLGITTLWTVEPLTAWAYAGVFTTVIQAGFHFDTGCKIFVYTWAVTEDSLEKVLGSFWWVLRNWSPRRSRNQLEITGIAVPWLIPGPRLQHRLLPPSGHPCHSSVT